MFLIQSLLFCYISLTFFANAASICQEDSTSAQEECVEPRDYGEICSDNKQCQIKTKNSICGWPQHETENSKCTCGLEYKLNSAKTECVARLPLCSFSGFNHKQEQLDCKKNQFCQHNFCYCRGPYEIEIIGVNGSEDVIGCVYPLSDCPIIGDQEATVLVPNKGCFRPASIGELCEHTEQCEDLNVNSFCDLNNSSNGKCSCSNEFIYHQEKCLPIQDYNENIERQKETVETTNPSIQATDYIQIENATANVIFNDDRIDYNKFQNYNMTIYEKLYSKLYSKLDIIVGILLCVLLSILFLLFWAWLHKKHQNKLPVNKKSELELQELNPKKII